MTITATGRFLPTDGLSLPFSRIKAQPWRALRLVACDVAVIGGAAAGMGMLLPGGIFTGASEPKAAAALAAMAVYLVWTLVSLAAWLRFLGGRELPGPLPHRLGGGELRLLGLYALGVVIAAPLVFVLGLPGVILGGMRLEWVAGFWMLGVVGLIAWFYARFMALPACVLLSGRFEPVSFWEETHPMRGRLRWALACLALIYAFLGFMVAIAAAATGLDYHHVLGQFDMSAGQLVRQAAAGGVAGPAWATAGAAITLSWLCRLMLRGVAVQAALVIEAGGETKAAQEPEPVSPPSSSASPDAPGPAPAGA
ncbi:hypothetical protein FKB34_09575 [Glycocaulis profundi]|nr:hypothetical protein FKB34_09575 [Glycocaulis profundi]